MPWAGNTASKTTGKKPVVSALDTLHTLGSGPIKFFRFFRGDNSIVTMQIMVSSGTSAGALGQQSGIIAAAALPLLSGL